MLSTRDIEIDPQRRRFGCRESDFAYSTYYKACVCVYYCRTYPGLCPAEQSCFRGEGGILEDMCYERRRAEACVD